MFCILLHLPLHLAPLSDFCLPLAGGFLSPLMRVCLHFTSAVFAPSPCFTAPAGVPLGRWASLLQFCKVFLMLFRGSCSFGNVPLLSSFGALLVLRLQHRAVFTACSRFDVFPRLFCLWCCIECCALKTTLYTGCFCLVVWLLRAFVHVALFCPWSFRPSAFLG